MANLEIQCSEEEYQDKLDSILDDILRRPRGDGIEEFLKLSRNAVSSFGLELAIKGKMQFAEALQEVGRGDYTIDIYNEILDAIDDDKELDEPEMSHVQQDAFRRQIEISLMGLGHPYASSPSPTCSLHHEEDNNFRQPTLEMPPKVDHAVLREATKRLSQPAITLIDAPGLEGNGEGANQRKVPVPDAVETPHGC